MRFNPWFEMDRVAPEGEQLERVLQRLKDGQCLACDNKPKIARRGLCASCERKFRGVKNRVPKRRRREWEERQIKAGKVLDAYQVISITSENPFAEV